MVALDVGKGIGEAAAEGQRDSEETGLGQVALVEYIMHNESSLKQ